MNLDIKRTMSQFAMILAKLGEELHVDHFMKS